MAAKHGWNTLDNFLFVHESVLKKYSGVIVTPVKYNVQRLTPQYLTLDIQRLELRCKSGNTVLVKIEKDVEVDNSGRRETARTYAYSYMSWRDTADGPQRLIRYCSPHVNHNKFHHRHDYTTSPKQLAKIGPDSWPHVNEFLDELIALF